MKFLDRWNSLQVKKKVQARTKTEVKARIDMSEEVAGKGLCPECKEPMKPVLANKMQCLCCMNCRIVLPIPE